MWLNLEKLSTMPTTRAAAPRKAAPARGQENKVKKTVSIDESIGELLELLLKKSNLSLDDLVNVKLRSWIAGNLDLLTPEDKKRFSNLKF